MKKFLVLVTLLLAVMIGGQAQAAGPWTATATLAYATDNQVTPAVALPGSNILGSRLSTIALYVPTIESSTVYLQVSGDGGTTYADLRFFNNGTNMVLGSSAAGTGGFIMTFPGVDFRNFTHVKVKCGTGQTADRAFKLFGN